MSRALEYISPSVVLNRIFLCSFFRSFFLGVFFVLFFLRSLPNRSRILIKCTPQRARLLYALPRKDRQSNKALCPCLARRSPIRAMRRYLRQQTQRQGFFTLLGKIRRLPDCDARAPFALLSLPARYALASQGK